MSAAALVVAGALLWVPGAVLARLLGVRRGWALATGPALTWGLVGAGAIAVPAAGLRWAPGSALAWWAVVAVVVLTCRRAAADVAGRRRRSAGSWPRHAGASGREPALTGCEAALLDALEGEGTRGGVALAACGVAAAAGLVVALAATSAVSLRSVSQLWDAVWHANLTAFIARTGSSDPTLAPTRLFDAGWRHAASFYPDALHAVAALVDDVSGAGPLVSLMAVVAVSFAALLPVGVAALTWTLTRGSGTGAAAAAVASVLSVAFPTDQWWRGVWAYGAGLAATPMACALVIAGLRGRAHRPSAWWGAGEGAFVVRRASAAGAAVRGLVRWAQRTALPAMVPGLLAVGGLVALQPAAAVVAALVLGGWALGRALTLRWPAAAGLSALALVGLAAAPTLVWAAVAASPTLASLAAYDYTTLPHPAAALRQVLGLVTPVDPGLGYGVPVQAPQHLLEAVFLVAFALVATARESVWLAALWALAVAAATATITPTMTPLRALTLFFYSSPYRLEAVVAVLGAVMTGVAAARLARWLGAGRVEGARVVGARRALLGVPAALAVVVVVVVAVIASGTLARGQVRLRAGFADRVVGPDQRRVMAALAAQPLPAGARILNDPVDGSPWMYALTGAEPMFTHYDVGRLPPSLSYLRGHLAGVDTDARVRHELRSWRICYVYTNTALVTARRVRAPGFVGLDAAASLRLVARSGGAAAYRVDLPGTSCASGQAAARVGSDG